MSEFYPIIFSGIMLLILSGLEVLFVFLLNRSWWKIRLIRLGSLIVPLVGIVGILTWSLGISAYKRGVIFIGATLTALDLVLLLALLLSLPISGIFNITNDVIEYFHRRRLHSAKKDIQERPLSNGRRRFLKGAAVVIPAASLYSASSGIANGFFDVKVYERKVPFANLPEDLDGFKILHLSDIHIGYFTWLDDVVTLLEKAKKYEPDIILATGDISDQLGVYNDALNLMHQFGAPFGVYATLGNHEYFRGITEIKQIFSRSPVNLLVNEAVRLTVGNGFLYLGGTDDPRRMHGETGEFYTTVLNKTMSKHNNGDFSVVMTHRPTAFDQADRFNVDFMLAGHTHGGQIGFNGRSVFETAYPKAYLWGLYEKNRRKLYTSSGVGHWFPFRLGCPAEAPIITLTKSESNH